VLGASVEAGAGVAVVVVASVVDVDVDVLVVDVVTAVDVGSSRPAPICDVDAASPPLESHPAATKANVMANAQIRLRMIRPLRAASA
jgi:hypothetical protein